ncbi:ATP-dependent protease [Lysobacter daejeonensis GH1-9]|uniref:ATP-dependent protease n=1 Tax=Lysobacter daejeonensis GH1-9 TaxID=1385517 RepID=A0A0A0EUQ8_9GAMM|nr:YifB family Mg chelatase-like AAA ATPase [Lysobacter daejeonensis]KGM53985.1 ATP-dependent protease [Lysobacter daejeonensis GH1-9]
MNLAIVHSRARSGVRAPEVRVEVHLGGGLPSMSIVGLPAAAVREAKDRVRAALQSSQLEFPARRITVNLAPADLPKDGGRFDLPIALGILAASGQIPQQALEDTEFLGELALTGELRAVDGALPATLATNATGRSLVLPLANGAEAALAAQARVHTARTLLEVCAGLKGQKMLPRAEPAAGPAAGCAPDLVDVRGQAHARRALEIAAAGSHHLLFLGPPGCGKSMLAARLPGLLPPPSHDEALESAAIASAAGLGHHTAHDAMRAWGIRPFRAPHHSASAIALVGGGGVPRPGEVSLAHNGVLFLDELPEWSRAALEVLREPLENGTVTVSRAARSVDFPARFQLVAAMNPCPCGWAGDASGRCRCSEESIARYRARVSGPLMDRIDLHVDVPRLSSGELRGAAPPGESSTTVANRVARARHCQLERTGKPNAQLSQAELRQMCALSDHDQNLLDTAADRLQLSARSVHRILRVARTIADLDCAVAIQTQHLTEAIGYRQVDRGAAVA